MTELHLSAPSNINLHLLLTVYIYQFYTSKCTTLTSVLSVVPFLLKSVSNVRNEPYREVRWALVAKERPDMFLDSSVEELPD